MGKKSSLITCKHCGQVIAASAKACPHCGGKNGKAKQSDYHIKFSMQF